VAGFCEQGSDLIKDTEFLDQLNGNLIIIYRNNTIIIIIIIIIIHTTKRTPAILLRIQEVPGSNLGSKTGYTN
jgi:hypothetical protein